MLLRTPSAGGGGKKVEGIDREGSISHDPLTLSFARLKWTRLEGLILGIVESRSLPLRVDGDGVVARAVSALSR